MPPALPPIPARRIQRPRTRTVLPAGSSWPAFQRRSIAPRQACSGSVARARPRPAAGSRSRTTSHPLRSGSRAAQRSRSAARASAAAPSPSTSAPRASDTTAFRGTAASTSTAIAPAGAPKCRRPVARPAPYDIGTSSAAAGIRAAAGSGPLGLPPAAGRHRDLLQRLHEHDVDDRAALVALEVEFGDDRALERVHVARGDPVQRVDQHVALADGAAAELREVGAQLLVGGEDVLLDEILDHAMASSRGTGETRLPVKVEPVVPVRRADRYWPAADSGRSTSTR